MLVSSLALCCLLQPRPFGAGEESCLCFRLCLGQAQPGLCSPGSAALIAKPGVRLLSGLPSSGGRLPSLQWGGLWRPHFGLPSTNLLWHSWSWPSDPHLVPRVCMACRTQSDWQTSQTATAYVRWRVFLEPPRPSPWKVWQFALRLYPHFSEFWCLMWRHTAPWTVPGTGPSR